MNYALSITVEKPFNEAVKDVHDALAGVGFGVLWEVDMCATLKNKIGADIPKYLILGVCLPELAYEAVQAEPSVGLLLPCNVIVRQLDDSTTAVEALDTEVIKTVTGNDKLDHFAKSGRDELARVLNALETNA